MAHVSLESWKEKARNLTKWREKRTSPPSLDLYKSIVEMVFIGNSVADVGAGQCHLKKCLPDVDYTAYDPFPIVEGVIEMTAEMLNAFEYSHDTVFMLSALDNVMNVETALEGLKSIAKKNIVILTGIDIPVDIYHTHKISRNDLVNVLGEPKKEVRMLQNVYLFEWTL